MKKHEVFTIIISLVVSVMVFTSCESRAPAGLTEQDRAFFQQVTVNAYESFTRGDRQPYVDRYTDDALFLAPHMEMLAGKKAIQAYIDTYPPVRVEFPLVEIFGNAKHANIRGTFVITDPDGNLLDKGKYISVWQKSAEGKWELTHDIFNSDIPLPVEEEDSLSN